MTILYRALLVMMVLTSFTFGQSPTNLPDISLIGNFHATRTDGDTDFAVKELELAFQQYLYPGVRADVFLAIEKEEDGSRTVDLEEAYVTFSSIFDVVLPNAPMKPAMGVMVGKKLLTFGKQNAMHAEQRAFVDRPLAHQTFFGADHGLSGEGGQVAYLLPLPFFSQLEAGYWTSESHIEEGHVEAHGPEFENTLLLGRFWNSIKVKETELEVGASYLLGDANGDDTSAQPSIWGLDLTYTRDLSPSKQFTLQAEYLKAEYGDDGDAKEEQDGYFVSGVFKFHPLYSVGLRYDVLGQHGDEGQDENQIVYQVTRQLTETSKFRVQYQKPEHSESVVTAQFIFGMGPHAHVLQ